MAEKIEQSLPWLTILAIFVLTIFGAGVVLKEIMADTIIPTVTVGSAAPTIGTIVLNVGNAISLTENSNVYIMATATVTDTNGYADIKSVTSSLECNQTTTICGLGVGNAPTWCYYIPNGNGSSTCATTSCAGNSCTIVCGTPVWFVAEPTDASGTYPAKAWEIDITVSDIAANVARGSTTQELNILPAVDVSSSIAYGSLNPGGTSTEKYTNSTNTGNLKIDLTMLGTSTWATGPLIIDTGRQKYATESAMGDWATGTALASNTAALWNYDLIKPTATTTNTATGSIYWMIKIPDGQAAGSYSGTTTITPVWSATNG